MSGSEVGSLFDFTVQNVHEIYDGHIPALDDFYSSASVPKDIGPVFDPKGAASNVDSLGVWVLKNFKSQAKTLKVERFVLDKKSKGVAVPIIAPENEYVQHFTRSPSAVKEGAEGGALSVGDFELISTPDELRMEAQDAKRALDQAKAVSEAAMKAVADATGARRGAAAEFVGELQDAATDAAVRVEKMYEKFQRARSEYNSLCRDLREKVAGQASLARAKHQQDRDALRRAESCLDILKRWTIAQLAKGCSAIEETCRGYVNGRDPLEAGDMRAVLYNLHKRFRNSSRMGITATTVNCFQEAMSGKQRPLIQHIRKMQECSATWDELGFLPLTVGEAKQAILSMVFIAGMTTEDRNAFMESEDQTEAAIERMAELKPNTMEVDVKLDEPVDAADILRVSEIRRTQSVEPGDAVQQSHARSSQYQRVVEFANRRDTQGLFRNAFDNKASAKPKEKASGKAEAEKASQQVFTAEEEDKRGICYKFQKGECKRGETCHFRHVLDPAALQQAEKNKSAQATAKETAKKEHVKGEHKAAAETTQALVAVAPFGTLDSDSSSDEEGFTGGYVVTGGYAGTFTESYALLPEDQQKTHNFTLNWDTCSGMHIANNVNMLDAPKRYKSANNTAQGIGGSATMTHIGDSSKLNLRRVRVIENQNVPHLMSVGRVVQRDQSGREGAAIFGAKGAVQIRLDEAAQKDLCEVIERCRERGLVEGEAKQKGYVYVQSLDKSASDTQDTPAVDDEVLVAAVGINLFAGRVKMDGAAAAVDLLAKAGLSEQILTDATEIGTTSGLPERITKGAVKKYFREHGKGAEAIEAGITRPVRRTPLGHIGPAATAPGETLMIDNMDVPFSRVPVQVDSSDPSRVVMQTAKSLQGYKDAVLAVDENSMYAHLVGRKTKKDPHVLVQAMAERWRGRWGVQVLQNIKCDAEFVTIASEQYAAANGLRIFQAPPGEHAMVQGSIESIIRWISDGGQANMNNLSTLVARGIITDKQKSQLWFHALLHSVCASNLRRAKNDDSVGGMTRLEVGTGKHVSLATTVMLPFGLPIVSKKLRNDGKGRGMLCLYLGASALVPGGVIVFNPRTGMIAVTYQFAPMPMNIASTPEEQLATARKLYNGMNVAARAQSGEMAPGSEGDSARLLTLWPETGVPEEPEQEAQQTLEQAVGEQIAQQAVPAEPGGPTEQQLRSLRKKQELPVQEVDRSTLPYQTRHINKRVLAVQVAPNSEGMIVAEPVIENVEQQRPPKPPIPPARQRKDDPLWAAARNREAEKIMSAGVLGELPVDADGNLIFPENAMVHKLINRYDYKWKVDPLTGNMRWLESVRCVSDGSVDTRKDIDCYAETPERTLLFLTLGLSATAGEYEVTADVERAYLNADSLDENVVILAPDDMPLPKISRLLKGLYGERKASRGWDIHIDRIMTELKWKKLDICRGMYLKIREDGKKARAQRHSDDVKMGGNDISMVNEEAAALSAKIKMSPWTPVRRFLGVEIERVNLETGEHDDLGQVALVRQTEKINSMEARFQRLHDEYNPRGIKRETPGPCHGPESDDATLHPDRFVELNEKGTKLYQELVGTLTWIAGARPQIKFACLLLSKKCLKPRKWDMQNAVWAMDYLVNTADTPLVLGGPVLDPETTSDSSFATMEERETVLGHGITTAPLSGAIEAHSKTTKSAITSVWETELVALSDAVKAQEFVTHACEEMGYDIPPERKVYCDNKGVLMWGEGNASNKRSRHVDVKYYYVRHAVRDGRVTIEYVPTKENYADVLTKGFSRRDFKQLAARILGHKMVQGKGIKGVFEVDSEAELEGKDTRESEIK
jgi:hypothetical protein